MGRVAGKVAIVTGAASGMGRADACLLAKEGARVVVADINERDGQALAAEIGEQACFMRLDVADEDNWRTVVASTLEQFGGLHILVNNAGMLALGSVVDEELANWRKLMSVNADSVFLGCKHAIPAMQRSGGGSIVNISSIAAMQGMSMLAAYSASKGAIRSLTKSVALYCKEQSTGVRCNSIHPDGVRTPMIVKVATGRDSATREEIEAVDQAGMMCEPEDVAQMVLYLASDESRFVNGAEMLIDNASLVTPPVTAS